MKEQLRTIYDATTLEEAHAELASSYELARTAGTPEVLRQARTIKRWEPQVLSYFTTWHTNARSQAQNLINEKLPGPPTACGTSSIMPTRELCR